MGSLMGQGLYEGRDKFSSFILRCSVGCRSKNHMFVQVAATMKRPVTVTRISNSISVLVVVMVDTVVLVIVCVTTRKEHAGKAPTRPPSAEQLRTEPDPSQPSAQETLPGLLLRNVS